MATVAELMNHSNSVQFMIYAVHLCVCVCISAVGRRAPGQEHGDCDGQRLRNDVSSAQRLGDLPALEVQSSWQQEPRWQVVCILILSIWLYFAFRMLGGWIEIGAVKRGHKEKIMQDSCLQNTTFVYLFSGNMWMLHVVYRWLHERHLNLSDT